MLGLDLGLRTVKRDRNRVSIRVVLRLGLGTKGQG